jgi:predicted AlkP superfamily pyrophosphatase or phosphodiesterase
MRGLGLCLVLLAALLGAASAASAKPDLLILVSIDGFRADYLQRGQTPAISALAADGVSAAMRPAFPSLTFPNHYTLVTGLYPDHHGVIDNTMDDPVLGHFTLAHSLDPGWWNGAEPLWVTADAQGLKTATLFWPGSDREIRGSRPDRWRPYDKAVPADARVDQVLKWLDLPQDQRPDFITLYFDLVDTVGHSDGPDSPPLDAALRSTDAALGRLVEGLKARGLYGRANLILVADHGMAEVSPERVVYLDDGVGAASIKTVTEGASAGLSIAPDAPQDTLAKLLALQGHVRCWRKADLPPELHYGRNPRVPQVVCLADVGWLIATHAGAAAKKGPPQKGAHGYRPDAPQMAALFVAHGPAFKPGLRLPAFDNVDVQPLMVQLLGLNAPPGDGSAAVFAPALAAH